MFRAQVLGLDFPSPILLASGILGETAGSLNRVQAAGAGGVVTKSIGLMPQAGHPMPNVIEEAGGLLNAMGLPNPGIDHFVKELEHVERQVPIIGSIFGGNAMDFSALAKSMAEEGKVDALELNVSCPHADQHGSVVCQDEGLLYDVVHATKKAVTIPIIVKLPPNSLDIARLAELCVKAGADAITAVNTLSAMAIDINTGKPILGYKTGGLSGPPLKPVGLAAVYRIKQRVKVPIIGVGGISTGRDILEYIMVGADLVQIGSIIKVRGEAVFTDLLFELQEALDQSPYGSLDQAFGVAHE